MNATEEKLEIAIEALLELKTFEEDYFEDMSCIRARLKDVVHIALQEIQRDHYFNEPSPLVRRMLPARIYL